MVNVEIPDQLQKYVTELSADDNSLFLSLQNGLALRVGLASNIDSVSKQLLKQLKPILKDDQAIQHVLTTLAIEWPAIISNYRSRRNKQQAILLLEEEQVICG